MSLIFNLKYLHKWIPQNLILFLMKVDINSSVSESIVLMAYELSETNFNDPNLQTCLYMLRDRICQIS